MLTLSPLFILFPPSWDAPILCPRVLYFQVTGPANVRNCTGLKYPKKAPAQRGGGGFVTILSMHGQGRSWVEIFLPHLVILNSVIIMPGEVAHQGKLCTWPLPLDGWMKMWDIRMIRLDRGTPLSEVEIPVPTQGFGPTFLRIGTWSSQHTWTQATGTKVHFKLTASFLSGDNAMTVSHNQYLFWLALKIYT